MRFYHDNIGRSEVAEGKYVNDGGQDSTAFTGRYYAENKTLNPMNGENGAASRRDAPQEQGLLVLHHAQIQKEFVQEPLRSLPQWIVYDGYGAQRDRRYVVGG